LLSRDGRRGTPQIVYGLLCAPDGCPVAVDVFEGSVHDDKTLPRQLEKLRRRFGLERVIVVSDRGMVAKANLELQRDAQGAACITALNDRNFFSPAPRTVHRCGPLGLGEGFSCCEAAVPAAARPSR